MGKHHVCLVVALAACGSSDKKPIDALIIVPDVAIDAKVFNDAPIDAPPMLDFSCLGVTPPTTATDPVTVSGTTQTYSQSGASPVVSVTINSYKSSAPATSIDQVTSNATTGDFTTGNLDVGNTAMPVDGFLKATKATYRTSYLFPAYPLAAAVTMIPVFLVDDTTFGLITSQLVFNVTQDDTANGVIVAAVTDCANNPISGATLKVQQSAADVGDQHDLSTLSAQAAGVFIVFNVPDGATQVWATYNNMTFPTHTVLAHKKPTGSGAEGTITLSFVRPGP
jgi:hypothetical protein